MPSTPVKSAFRGISMHIQHLKWILLGPVLALLLFGHGFAAEWGWWSVPPSGQPAQMSSRVHYDPKLSDPFFKSEKWCNPNGSYLVASGTGPEGEHPQRLKCTANVRVSPVGYSEHPPVRFCEARLLDTNSMDLFIHGSTASSNDALLVQIRNGVFWCQYWGGYPCVPSMQDGKVIWTTTKQKLTLDKKVYRKGDEVRGRIYFECLREPTDPRATEECGWRGTIIVRGVFKTKVE